MAALMQILVAFSVQALLMYALNGLPLNHTRYTDSNRDGFGDGHQPVLFLQCIQIRNQQVLGHHAVYRGCGCSLFVDHWARAAFHAVGCVFTRGAAFLRLCDFV